MSFKIAGENYLFYILNIEGNEPRILAVAKEEKNFTWSLSDFFKVFFVHTVIILTAFLFVAFWNFKKLKAIFSSYKTKLSAAFVVVSVIPMIVIAVYFKNITEGKNSELIFNRLDESAGQIKNYLKNYLESSSVQPEYIFQKTSADLGVNFNIYRGKNIFYSSNIDYYNAGLLPEIIPMNVWFDIQNYGLDKSFYKSAKNGQNNYSIFMKSYSGANEFIIEVNSRLNSASLPLSDIEVDVFLFGVFSLAIIMLIVFSTILAEQISAPVRKLTNAARALGSGDLNVEVTGNYSGEIAELTNGFNNMVKRLRKSQIEMAQLERENAWKEMAKQVAHEIKNPLTPMKLSVQQLIAAYNDKSPKFDSIFEKVTSMVISQIETLKNIASEFSNFARMPKLNIEKINLVDSVIETVNLFLNEKLQIKYSCAEREIFVKADHDQLNRTLINLVRNSMQASAKNIFIDVNVEKDLCLLRVIDDGEGIENENIDKVFEDKFTTKSGGMGLGLSMAKKYFENINGNISIEKTSKEGTVFLIIIPIAE
jgi:signal transduction histidine kinase